MLATLKLRLQEALNRVFVRSTLYAFFGLSVFSLTLIGMNYYKLSSQTIDRLTNDARGKASLVTNIAAREIKNKNYGEVERLLNALVQESHVIAAKAYGRFGQEFASDYLSAVPSSEVQFSEIALNAAQDRKSQFSENSQMLEYTLPAFRGGEAVGSVSIRMSKEEIAGFQRDALWQAAILLGVLILAFVPVLGWLMYRATAGVSQVTQAANEAAEGFLDCDLKTNAPGEVGELQTAFRRMMVKLRENMVSIERLAYTDRITNLPNRAQLDKQALTLIDMNPKACGAVIYIGLDRFKMINELHGHAVGDQLLGHLSSRLVRLVDELGHPHTQKPPTVARFSGDEFVAILPGLTDKKLLHELSETVLKLLSKPVRVGPMSLSVSASAGVVTYPEHGKGSEEVMRNANLAMFEAKTSGRSRFVAFNERIREQVTEREKIADRLHQAVEDEALVVHYQPKIDLRTGNIVGSEALLRWTDEELGFVSPVKFIPVAEERGLIVPIGEFVLKTALEDMKALHQADVGVSVAVNVAPVQLQNAGFTDKTLGIIGESGFQTEKLELEITESSLMDYSEFLLDQIRPIQREGVKFAIDDFGTGYSSLHSLANMPFDTLKIDRSFIMDIASCEDRRAIVELILMMARQLKMDTVSEGIETDLQRDFINLWGGTLGQGFLWSPAVPIAEFSEMVQASQNPTIDTTTAKMAG
ncbi:MAG: sensor domain-containing phosphodiesterase [Roseibium sp.]